MKLMSQFTRGFSLIELMVAVAVVGLLGAVAYPSYTDSITKSKRASAKACLSTFAIHMERFYATNMRYDKDTDGDDIALPALECSSAQNTGEHYSYSLVSADLSATSFTLQAAPKGVQAKRDIKCATLGLSHTGAKSASGTGGTSHCW